MILSNFLASKKEKAFYFQGFLGFLYFLAIALKRIDATQTGMIFISFMGLLATYHVSQAGIDLVKANKGN